MRAGALAAAVLATGCVTWRGPFERGLQAPRGDAVSIILLGESARASKARRTSADAVTAVLGRGDAVVVHLGDDRIAIGEKPARTIGTGAVRIGRGGSPRLVSRCEARTCELVDEREGDRLELVVLDLDAWRRAKIGNDDALAHIEALLDVLARTPAKVPRVLVTSLPIEGGFEHGLGALAGPSATFHNLPARVQRAIAEGMFVGAIAGGEQAVHATHDVGAAVQRTDKTWLAQPVWQVVSGNAAGRSSPWRHTKLARGVGFEPELATDRTGFAVLEVGEGDTAQLDLYARRRNKWWRARTALTLSPPRHHGPRDAPRMPPCMRCDEVPATDRR